MITVEEIRKKAENLYPDFLKSIINYENIFPKIIRSNKSVSDDFNEMRKELADVIEHSIDKKNGGYTIIYKKITTRKHGIQDLPSEIFFQTETDYLKFIKKEKEVAEFKKNINLILSVYPSLKNWLLKFPVKVIDNKKNWKDLLKVCDYFLQNPKPNLYIRELPIKIHTKFIEQNKAVLTELLNEILPEAALNTEFKEFEKRFGLKYDQNLIRMRFLDSKIYINSLTDISITESEFQNINISFKKVFITENKINFLSFPMIENSIAIFGKGFNVSILQNAKWLTDKKIFYWGDIDTHGLQILSQIKGYFNKTTSIMMDFETFNSFKEDWGTGEKTNVSELTNLNIEEFKLFNYLKENNLRLEQEKITQEFVYSYLKKMDL